MSIESIIDAMGDTAKDIRLNLSTVLTTAGSPELSITQIFGTALASAYATKDAPLINAIEAEAMQHLTSADVDAAKAAATIMAMNNIYYRFVHLVGDKDFSDMPAKLRMNVIANPGVSKIDFELYSLAVSAINGCGMCIESHTHHLIKAEVSKQAIQSAIRIAAVVNAAAQALAIAAISNAVTAAAA